MFYHKIILFFRWNDAVIPEEPRFNTRTYQFISLPDKHRQTSIDQSNEAYRNAMKTQRWSNRGQGISGVDQAWSARLFNPLYPNQRPVHKPCTTPRSTTPIESTLVQPPLPPPPSSPPPRPISPRPIGNQRREANRRKDVAEVTRPLEPGLRIDR